MSSTTDYRANGRRLKAQDLSERLLPDLSMNEFIAWAPDLFALTSYVMSHTGAYQLVVSPPSNETWPPRNRVLKQWLGITFSEGKWIANAPTDSDENIASRLKSWLTSFLRYEAAKGSKEWELDSKDWKSSEIDGDTGFFGNAWLTDLNRHENSETTIATRIAIIADHIAAFALKSLSAPLTGESQGTLLAEFKDVHLLIEKEKLNRETTLTGKEKEAQLEEFKLALDKKKTISLGDFLEDDDFSGWKYFVQIIGEEWDRSLKMIRDEEFQLINHSLIEEEGNIFFQCDPEFEDCFDGTALTYEKYSLKYLGNHDRERPEKDREKRMLGILLKNAPPLLLVCWAYFYDEACRPDFYFGDSDRALDVSDLLCNRDDIQIDSNHKLRLWKLSQSIFTLHAIADICCTTWGIYPVENPKEMKAKWFAEKLLYDKGSLSTINPERGRVIPKRHNPGVGITLRSISSNLAFHRSSVEVVWRKTAHTTLEDVLTYEESEDKLPNKPKNRTISMLLLPFPLDVKAKHFLEDTWAESRVDMASDYGFFKYSPQEDLDGNDLLKEDETLVTRVTRLIEEATQELDEDRFVDIVVFPESSLSKEQYEMLEEKLSDKSQKFSETPARKSDRLTEFAEIRGEIDEHSTSAIPMGEKVTSAMERFKEFNKKENRENIKSPSILIAGVRESRRNVLIDIIEKNASEIAKEPNEDKKALLTEYGQNISDRAINFDRNAVYCKYFNEESKSFNGKPDRLTRKFKQYKHHRWQLNSSQIKSYGLSQVLETERHKIWWEAMKVPKRRVSFLNVGKAITISHLVCEDLARQDPISDLIRHVGPSLVVTLLMDGPQLKNRWSSRYASILSDDPGSSVITLTSFGMTKRYNSPYGLMSRVIALWSESKGTQIREIELANGAEAVLLTLKLEPHKERTADGREERIPTNTLTLVDVIQVYPPPDIK